MGSCRPDTHRSQEGSHVESTIHPSRPRKDPRAGDSPPHRRPRRDGVLASIVSWRISLSPSSKRSVRPLVSNSPYANTPPGRRLRGGFGLHPLPCGDRRVLPPTPDGPLAFPDPDRRPRGTGSAAASPLRGPGLQYAIRPTDRMSSTQRHDGMPTGRIIVAERGRGPVRARLREPGIDLPDRTRRIPLRVPDHLVLRASGAGTSPRAMRRRTPTSIGRSSPIACSATRTGSSRSRARSTAINRRSSVATRSAASGAMGPASSTSERPDARRRP